MERAQVNLGIELSIKCVVVGDNCAQKSQFLLAYMTNKPPGEYVPTVFDNFSTEVEVEGHRVNLGLWDTAGQEEYDRLRSLAYPQADVFLLMFSIGHPISLTNIKTKWWKEIMHHCPDTPFLLVGNNMEMRTDPDVIESMQARGLAPIPYEDGLKVAYEIGAYKYLENSSLNCFGMREVIDEAVRVVLLRTFSPKKKSKRKLLVSSLIPQPPPAPKVEVAPSTYLSDWMSIFNKHELADVSFTFKNDDRRLWAHKALLCSSSEVMRLLFMGNTAFTLRKRSLKKSKSDGNAQEVIDKRRSRHNSDVRKLRHLKKIPSLDVPNSSPKKVSPVESPRENGGHQNGTEGASHIPGYYTNREITIESKDEGEAQAALSTNGHASSTSITINNTNGHAGTNGHATPASVSTSTSPTSSPASSYSTNSLRNSAKLGKSNELVSPRLEVLKPRRLRRGTESRIRHIKSDEIDLDELFGDVTQETDGTTTVVVNKAKYETFALLIKFLYGVKLDDHFRQHSSELKDIAATAASYHCSKLAEYCLNVWIGAELLNTSIKSFFDDEKKNSLKKYFLSGDLWTDVVFVVENKVITAHKVILASRCAYFNAMFTGEFMENKSDSIAISDVSCDAFQQFVNYIYTDQCTITSNNVADLLMISNKYGVNRLTNQCEQFVASNLSQEDEPEIVVEVLKFASQHNGTQLVTYCLHWLAVNHVTYEGRKEVLDSLSETHKRWIEKHRWPHKTEIIGLSKQLLGEDSREGKCLIQ